MKISKITIFTSFFLIVALLSLVGFQSIFSASVLPELVPGNPTCQQLGYQYEFKIDPPNSGTYYLPQNVGSVTVTTTGQGTFDWSSTFGIDAVIAKGGPNANVYKYDPPSESFGDTNLSTPINPQNGRPYGLSHINFCFDVDRVQVSKTATTSYDRTWGWNITKTATPTDFGTIQSGEIKTATYTITLTATSTDSNWKVSGTITIFNPTTNPAAIIQNVFDVLNFSGSVTVDCGVNLPYTLPGGQSLICTYSKDVNGPNDTLNIAEVMAITYVATDTPVLIGGGATAPVIWGEPNQIDECVTVNDTNSNGPQNQQICANNLDQNNSYTFNYQVTFSKDQQTDVVWQCNQTEYQNIASFVTTDSGAHGQSTWIIRGNIQCEIPQPFCALSQGYWFAKPNVVWPDVNGTNYGEVTIGGYNYSQQEGIAIWKTSNKGGIKDSKKAFLQVAAIKLSGGDSSNLPAYVWADVQLIESWLSGLGKLSPNNLPTGNKAVSAAAGRLGDWIEQNHCSE